jgi:hypothetical protein
LLDSWDTTCPCLGDIRSALKATAAVASYINQRCHADLFWTDEVLAARLLSPAMHEVLSLEDGALPSDPSDPNYSGTAARKAFRRSALIFLASLRARFIFGCARFELARHIHDFRLISKIPGVDWAVVPELNLWAHAIAALQEESGERSWHVETIVGIMEGSLALASGRQALDVVRGIIWVEAVFADKVGSLCREIDGLIASKAAHRLSTLSTEDNQEPISLRRKT